MKLLGLDVGDARIGLAVADTGRPFAFGRGWIKRVTCEDDVAAVIKKAQEEEAEMIVIGLPLRTGGDEGEQAAKVRRLAKRLQEAGLRVEFADERFTTRLASQRLSHLPRRKRQEKGRLDEAAAVAILETYLERLA